MYQRLITMLAVFAAVVLLSACEGTFGSKDEEMTSEATTSEATTSEATTSESATTTEADTSASTSGVRDGHHTGSAPRLTTRRVRCRTAPSISISTAAKYERRTVVISRRMPCTWPTTPPPTLPWKVMPTNVAH